jgi:hypothetical protein
MGSWPIETTLVPSRRLAPDQPLSTFDRGF